MAFPIEVGQKWNNALFEDEANNINTITSISSTITTPVGTFNDVIEVTTADGYKIYYAYKVGQIQVMKGNTVISQLVEIK